MPTSTKRLVICGHLGEASKVQQQILDEVQGLAYTESACFAIRLAIEEALSNAIMHGCDSDPNKHVTVEYSIDDDQVAITICDEGTGFTPGVLPDPRAQENLDKPNGRGIMLIRAYMTDVRYNDRGNCITMVKRRDCPLPQLSG